MLLGQLQKLRQHAGEPVAASERLHATAAASTDQDQPRNALGPLPISLERNLTPHRVPDQNDPPVSKVTADLAQVARMRCYLNTLWVNRGRGTTVTTIVPMSQPGHMGKVIPQIHPDVSIAADSVAENR